MKTNKKKKNKKEISLILLSAGESSRFQLKIKKQWLRIGRDPLWLTVLKRFKSMGIFSKIIITAPIDEVNIFKNFTEVTVVAGGFTRQQSIRNGLIEVDTPLVMISDVARCFIPETMVNRLIKHADSGDIIVPYLPITDTVVFEDKTIERELVKIIQTPQLSKTDILREIINSEEEFTDESSLFVAKGYNRFFVLGDKRAAKLTYLSDLTSSKCFDKDVSNDILVGIGFDVHQFEAGDLPLKLGGVEIHSELNFKAHSDGDVLIHSLIDAILGAAGLGDIGAIFPDSDIEFYNIDSIELLEIIKDKITLIGLEIVNIDITVIAEIPKLNIYKQAIQNKLSEILEIDKSWINIKATTTEKLGFLGRKEGLAVQSVVNLKYINWRNL